MTEILDIEQEIWVEVDRDASQNFLSKGVHD
jgi:hypothetical protein